MSTPLHIAVEYELKSDAKVDEVIAAIQKFVGNVSSAGLGISYKSLRRPEGAFLHFIQIPDKATLEKLQAQPFVSEFGKLLKPNCAVGPSVARLSLVAETT